LSCVLRERSREQELQTRLSEYFATGNPHCPRPTISTFSNWRKFDVARTVLHALSL
jgi:hypothetical protein